MFLLRSIVACLFIQHCVYLVSSNQVGSLRSTRNLPPPPPPPVMEAPFHAIELPDEKDDALPTPQDDSELNAIVDAAADVAPTSDDNTPERHQEQQQEQQHQLRTNKAIQLLMPPDFNERKKKAEQESAEEALQDVEFAQKQKQMDDNLRKTLAHLNLDPSSTTVTKR